MTGNMRHLDLGVLTTLWCEALAPWCVAGQTERVLDIPAQSRRDIHAIKQPGICPMFKPLIGDAVDAVALARGRTELMRVKASNEAGAVVPSTTLRKLPAAGTPPATVNSRQVLSQSIAGQHAPVPVKVIARLQVATRRERPCPTAPKNGGEPHRQDDRRADWPH